MNLSTCCILHFIWDVRRSFVILAASVGAEPGAGDYLALFDLNIRRLVEAAGPR